MHNAKAGQKRSIRQIQKLNKTLQTHPNVQAERRGGLKQKNMKDKKFQIFVSSTYTDLKEERQAAVEAILSAGHIPAGMELFSAGDESQMTVIKRWIDESDIYLLILGGRYGSIEPKSGKSYTQLEFEYAVEIKKPYFSVVITEKGLDEKVASHLKRNALEDKYQKELTEFKMQIMSSNVVREWDDKKDIKIAIHETLSDFSYSKKLVGWVKADNVINSALVADEIAKLSKENSDLREKLNSLTLQDNTLYSGLKYEQLKTLLEKSKFDLDGKPSNLFKFLLFYGSKLIEYSYYAQNDDISKFLDVLTRYRILNKSFENLSNSYIFTEDGHKFYLRSLFESLTQENKKES